jgi:ABC-type uncharacterized transport system permease subunit
MFKNNNDLWVFNTHNLLWGSVVISVGLRVKFKRSFSISAINFWAEARSNNRATELCHRILIVGESVDRLQFYKTTLTLSSASTHNKPA